MDQGGSILTAPAASDLRLDRVDFPSSGNRLQASYGGAITALGGNRGSVDLGLTLDAFRVGGSAWVGTNPPLGPLLVAVAVLEESTFRWVFRLGTAC